MARFQGLAAFVLEGGYRYPAGTTYATDDVSMVEGDILWAIDSASYSPMLLPLDAEAAIIKSGSPYGGGPSPCTISGAQSIR